MNDRTEGENSQADSNAFVAPLTPNDAPAPIETENKQATEQPAAQENEAPALEVQEEAVARARGWVPKEQFRGDPNTWQDAKSFLDRNASLQTDVRELRETLDKRERDYMEKLSRIERVTETVVKRTREDAQRQIDMAKRAAVELGDTEAYERLEQQETALYDRFRQEDEAVTTPAQTQETEQRQKVQLLPETTEWMGKNPWFNSNPALHKIALGFYDEAGERFTGEAERLKYVDERLGILYPERFPEKVVKKPEPTSQMPSLEGGTRMPGGNQNLAAQLPADVRTVAERFVKRGLFKDVAEYAKSYFEE